MARKVMTTTDKVLAIIAAITLILIAWAVYGVHEYINGKEAALKKREDVPKMRPVLNPHPSQFIDVYGHVDKGLQVSLVPAYSSHKKDCQIVVALIEGAVGDRYKYYPIPIIPDKQGNYRVKIAIDKLKKGYCDWGIGTIMYRVAVKGLFTKPDENEAVELSNKIKLVKLAYIDKGCRLHGRYTVCDTINTNLEYETIPLYAKTVKIDFFNSTKGI